jgi:RNA polymerase sigma-70 factor (ECF subfamily)
MRQELGAGGLGVVGTPLEGAASAEADLGPAVAGEGVGCSDAELVETTRAGDLRAFEELMRRHGPRVFGTVRRYARRESEVEDLAQEIWIKAFQKLDSYRGEAPFEHWLMRLAVRTCYDALRRHQRNREASFTDLSQTEQEWLLSLAQEPGELEPHQAEAARQLVQQIMEQLSAEDRVVLTLLELQDRSVREIADLTGWSVATVKVRAFRARARMRRLLTRLLQREAR